MTDEGLRDLMDPTSRAWVWRDPVLNTNAGFIELKFNEEDEIEHTPTLSIQMVRRPPTWPHPRFCSSILPAAIQEMLTVHHLNAERLTQMSVLIKADPYVRACKCYIRVMAGMGFTHSGDWTKTIVGPVPTNEAGVEAFCAKPERDYIMVFMGDPETHPHLPYVSVNDTALLRTRTAVIDTFHP